MSRPITLESAFWPIMLRPIMFFSIICCPIMLGMLSWLIMLRFITLEDMSRPIMLEYMFLPMLEDLSIKPYMLRWEDIWFILFPCITFLDISCPIKLYTRGPSRGGLELSRELSLRADESM